MSGCYQGASEILQIQPLYSAPLQSKRYNFAEASKEGSNISILSVEEVNRFRNAIDIKPICGLRFRTLVEILLATGMRISECLSLTRNSVDFVQKEARIIGKGNKERIVFFTDEALEWVKRYVDRRDAIGDKHESLFTTTFKRTTQNGKKREVRPLRNQDINRVYKKICAKAGLNKNISNHTLRHTFATILLKKGIGLGHIQVLLGHSDIQTTSRHYLGILSDEEAKKAHEKGMDMDNWL